jgi:hypothetical protein
MQIPEKYRENFGVSSKALLSGCLYNKYQEVTINNYNQTTL